MPLPPWTVELIRRGISDVARKASDPETLEKLKSQATEILQDLPETAARGIDAVMRTAEAGKQSVEKWSRKQTAITIPMINASGVLMHSAGAGVRLSDDVMSAGLEIIRGDCLVDAGTDERLQRKLEKTLPSGGELSIAVASSFPAALTAFSQLVEDRSLVIHRNHAVRLPDGTPLPEAFGTLLPVIQEIGSVGEVNLKDYDGLDAFCSIVADVGDRPVEIQDFGSRDALQAVVLPVGTLAETTFESIPSAESLLKQGADLVLMPGDGICGGPPCGLVVGHRDSLTTIKSSPAWPSLVANNATQAMMAAALETAQSSPTSLPALALMDTSEENLQSRADRMSTRLAVSSQVGSARITNESARLTENGRWEVSSRQLRLKHADQSADAWAEKLRDDLPAVIVRVDNDEIVIDLRWVDAANDNQLATAIGGGSSQSDPASESS